MTYRLSSSLFLLFLFVTNLTAQTHQEWTKDAVMYEVNVRQYSQEGTFAAVMNDLDRLDSLGVKILWFMPIYPIGQENRIGTLGSYYSVQNYVDVNPEFGTIENFKVLVDSIHARGMYAIVDWVANHTSWDNVLTETNPEWYQTNNSGEFIPPPNTNWSDVIQLDHSKQGLRDFMKVALKYWVEQVGVDGFRFDAASFVPSGFWEEVLPAVKESKSDLLLLAETDVVQGTDWYAAGFDQTYSWSYYGFEGGVIKDIVDGNANAGTFESFGATEKRNFKDGKLRLYFTSNHDENSWHGTTTELFGNAARVFAVISQTLNGMPLIYNGQEAGINKRLQFFEKDLIPWRDHPNFEFYQALTELRKRNSALWSGINENFYSRIYSSQNAKIHAYFRENGDDRVLVFTNLSATETTFTTSEDEYAGNYTDIFSKSDTTLAGRDQITLPPWGYLVYEGGGSGNPIEIEDAPSQFSLSQNYPNPFNPTTNIEYALKQASHIQLELFDATGRRVMILDQGLKSSGTHNITVQATGLSSGIYLYRLSTPDGVLTKKLMVLK